MSLLALGLLWLAVASAHLSHPADTAAAPPRVEPPEPTTAVVDVSPRGTVKHVRQVTARFRSAMTRLGDSRATTPPVEIACTPAQPGRGRWIDSRTFVFDFTEELPGGIRCAIDIRPDLRDLAGEPVAGERHFDLSTGGPAIQSERPSEESEIAEDQAFVLSLDTEPDRASVEAHAYFAVDGLPERVPVAFVDPAGVASIVASDPSDKPRAPFVVLTARRRFPAETKLRLVWGAGIRSTTGIATETDQELAYETRPPFRAEVRCERESPKAGCVPITPISLRFTAAVDAGLAARIALVAPDGTRFSPAPPDTPDPHASVASFAGPFPPSTTLRVELPEGLRDDAGRELANASELSAQGVVVDALPPLAKFAARFGIIEAKAEPALPITIRGLEPGVRTRMLSLQGGSKTPPLRAAVHRLPTDRAADVLQWLRQVHVARRERSLLAKAPAATMQTFDLPQPAGEAMQVVGIPIERPGVYVVEVESKRLGQVLLDRDAPMYVQAAALVTDLAVHFEWGRTSSLVWVTSLEKAEPVPNAEVAVHDCGGKVLWQGRTDADGLARIGKLPEEIHVPICRDPSDPDEEWDPYRGGIGTQALASLTSGLFVTAQNAEDFAFVHSSWNDGIETYRWNLPSTPWQGPFAAHSVLARALLRAGDVAHMKHVFRAETPDGLAYARPGERPTRAVIRHVGSDTTYEFPLSWEEDGSAETAWTIPRDAKLGRYEVVLVRPTATDPPDSGNTRGVAPPPRTPRPTPTPAPPYEVLERQDEFRREWVTAELRVEEFRVPLMRASLQLPASPLVSPQGVTVDVAVQVLAGGAAAGLPVTLRGQLAPTTLSPPPDLAGFTVGNGAITPGIKRQEQGTEGSDAVGTDGPSEPSAAANGSLGGAESTNGETADAPGKGSADREGPDASRVRTAAPFRARRQVTLDSAGTARATLGELPVTTAPRRLLVEAEFRDPNGETQTASASAQLWPASLLPAIQAEVRRDGKRRITATVAALDTSQKPVAGVPIVVELFRRITYTTRQRVVGGFYAYQDVEEIRRVKTLCRGRSNASGKLSCVKRTPAHGELIVQAHLRDPEGRTAAAHAEVWVPGPEDAWFAMSDSDRMDLLPDQRRYEPGATARVQVRMPFRRARALVSIVREGVLDARVVVLSGKDPQVDVPIHDSFSPNVFVQVLAVRERVGSIQPTATLDLGKPAFRLGIAELEVGWKPHTLDVRVTPERTEYRVRDTARVTIEARPALGASLPAGAALAVAAVDEGLLELLPNASVELLRAMMGRRGTSVQTSTAQMQVVGKRHFGKKALPAGGGGGKQTTRELFDTLLLWRGRVPLDGTGRATIDVPLNDSLTSFRIVAVATAGPALFGTGEATVRSSQDLMLFSGLPPVVRSGDRYRAEFTVRNTTHAPVDVEIAGRAVGLDAPDLAPERVRLGAGEARIVGWPAVAPERASEVAWEVSARSEAAREVSARSSAGASDRLSVKQRVAPAVPVHTLQSTLTQWVGTGPIVQPVAMPAGALPGRGGVDVSLAPSLVAGIAGVRAWMASYPYSCLEQKVSRAVVAGDAEGWRAVASELAAAQDGNGLFKYFPSLAHGDVELTAYVVNVASAAGSRLPAPVEKRVKQGLRAFLDGTLPRRNEGALDPGLPLRKLAAAAALAALGDAGPDVLSGVTIEPNLWPTSAVLDWWSFLQRVSKVNGRAARLADVENVLRARLDRSGTTLTFASSDGAGDIGSPFTGGDVDAVRLVALALQGNAFRDDQGQLVRGALARQRSGRWSSTVANAWGSVATRLFARSYESGPVTGTTRLTLAEEKREVDWRREPAGSSVSLDWPPGPADLRITHAGGGKPWTTISTRAAIPLAEPLEAGFRIIRTILPIERRSPDRWSVGDTLAVRLDIEANADLPWIVIDDPIPPGASHLARASDQTATPTFAEKTFLSYRAYFVQLPARRFFIEYAIRLNQTGTFHLPPSHVEAMYAPESFADLPLAPFEVSP